MKNRYDVVFAATLMFLLFGAGSIVAASGTFSGWKPVNSQNVGVFDVASQSAKLFEAPTGGYTANESLGLSLVVSAVLANLDFSKMPTNTPVSGSPDVVGGGGHGLVDGGGQGLVGGGSLDNVDPGDAFIPLDPSEGGLISVDNDNDILNGSTLDDYTVASGTGGFTNPEPGSMILLGTGLIGIGLAGYRRYKSRKQE